MRNQPAGDLPRIDFWLIVSRSCACHSPRTVLATASIFAKLVLYQLLLKCTKCQYGELTVSLLFSAQENTRHVHRASVSRNLSDLLLADLRGLYTGACAFEITAIVSEILVPSNHE